MDSKVIKSHQYSAERSHVVLKLILNYDQDLAHFRQKQTKIQENSEYFFIQLLYAWPHLTNNNFPAFIYI